MCHGHWPFSRNKTQRRVVPFRHCSHQTAWVCLLRIVRRWPICQIMTFRDDSRTQYGPLRHWWAISCICSQFNSKLVIRIQIHTVLTTYQPLYLQSKSLHRRNCHLNCRQHSKHWPNYRMKRPQQLQSKWNVNFRRNFFQGKKNIDLLRFSFSGCWVSCHRNGVPKINLSPF